jgi:hypothetical protein
MRRSGRTGYVASLWAKAGVLQLAAIQPRIAARREFMFSSRGEGAPDSFLP